MYLQPKSSSCGLLVRHAPQMVYMPADDNDNDNDNDDDNYENDVGSLYAMLRKWFICLPMIMRILIMPKKVMIVIILKVLMIKPMKLDTRQIFVYSKNKKKKYFCVKNFKIGLLWKLC